jgi:hypothetical protein
LRQVTLAELKQLALQSKSDLWSAAQSLGRDVTLYLHWSAGHYGQFFSDYHINIDQDGSIYVSTENLSELKSHTWHRNTGAIGIALACCYQANTNNLGSEPPTALQIEVMAQVVAVLAKALDLTIDNQRVMTHCEAATEDDYGPGSGDPETRWDLWFVPGVAEGEGGHIIRGKANWYQEQGDI